MPQNKTLSTGILVLNEAVRVNIANLELPSSPKVDRLPTSGNDDLGAVEINGLDEHIPMGVEDLEAMLLFAV